MTPRPSTEGDEPSEIRTFESSFRARSYELDSFDHVNHSVFLNWLEQARFDAFETCGFPGRKLTADGWAVVVARVEIDYQAEVRLGDALVVRTRLAESRNTSMTFEQRVIREPRRTHEEGHGTPEGATDDGDGVVAARALVVLVWLKDGRPRRVPAEIREAIGAP